VTPPREDDRGRREESGAAGARGDWRGQAPRPVGSQRFGNEEPVVRDKRRIDPETGAVRPEASKSAAAESARQAGPSGGSQRAAGQGGSSQSGTSGAQDAQSGPDGQPGAESVAAATVPAAAGGDLQAQLAERTADLQRLQAEYVNYRRRVDRDREAVRELAVIAVLTELLPILDDIGRARDHGELAGGFKSVAESLESTATKLGLERFGEPGEVFDPTVHEALMHTYSAEVAEPTCVEILQPGYRVGTRVIRPARVTVAEPDAAGTGVG
jgi:molecular chaperone GrpE